MGRRIVISEEEGQALAERCELLLEDNSYDWQLDEEEHNSLVDFWVDMIVKLDPTADAEKIRDTHRWVAD